MRQTTTDTFFSFDPEEPTPVALKYFLIILAVVGLSVALIQPIWISLTSATSPTQALSLSTWGISKFFLWQPFTYQFLLDSLTGISFWSLVGLAFNLYMTYWLGLQLIKRLTSRGFFALFVLSGAISGLFAIATAGILGQSLLLAGPSASLLTCFVLWCLFDLTRELYFFFVIRLTAQQVLYIILGFIGLINLSRGDFASIVLFGSAALIGYCVYRYLEKPFQLFETYTSEKIIPFPSYSIETESDEEFLDRMLEKISRNGEKSLSSNEKARLDRISKRKK